MPMRGKSMTCRHRALILAVSDRGHRPNFKGMALGKSETCRASAWPSHNEGFAKFKSETCRASAWPSHNEGFAKFKSETCRASAWPSHSEGFAKFKSETCRASAWPSHSERCSPLRCVADVESMNDPRNHMKKTRTWVFWCGFVLFLDRIWNAAGSRKIPHLSLLACE